MRRVFRQSGLLTLAMVLAACGEVSSEGAPPPAPPQKPVVTKTEALDPYGRAEAALAAGKPETALAALGDLPLDQQTAPRTVELRKRTKAAFTAAVAPGQGDALLDSIKTYWRPALTKQPTTPPSGQEDVRARLAFFQEMGRNLNDAGAAQLTPAQRAEKQRFVSDLASKQAQTFPQLRAVYAKGLDAKLWENDIRVQSAGEGDRTLRLTGPAFAANRNIGGVHGAVQQMAKELRFTRVEYRWMKGADEYSTYRPTVPSDRAVGEWNGSQFVEAK